MSEGKLEIALLSKKISDICLNYVRTHDENDKDSFSSRMGDTLSSLCNILAINLAAYALLEKQDPIDMLMRAITRMSKQIGDITGKEMIEVRGSCLKGDDTDSLGGENIGKIMMLVINQLQKEGHPINSNARCQTATKVNKDGSFEFLLKLQPKGRG